MRSLCGLPSTATRIFMAAPFLWSSDFDDSEGIEADRLPFICETACLADDAGAPGRMRHLIVVPAVQMAMQPEVGQRQQRVVGIAEARGAGLRAITRIGTAKTRSEVRHRHRRVPCAVRGPCELGGEPGAAGERFFAHRG